MGLPDARTSRRAKRRIFASWLFATIVLATSAASAEEDPARVEAELARIEALLARGRDGAALARVEALARRTPGSAMVVAAHRRVFVQRARSARQRAALVAPCNAPRDRAAALECARALALAGELDRAMRLATDRASAYDPSASAALADIAALAEASGDEETAARAAERAYALAPDDPARTLTAARYALRAGEPRAASALTEPLLVAQPANVEARVVAAHAAMLAGDHLRAIAHFQTRLARCETTLAICLTDLATAELYGRRVDDALAHATRAVEVACPGDPRPHRVLGMALVRKGREAEARLAFDESLRRRPDPTTRALLRALDPP